MQPCHVQGHVRINGSIAGARIPFFRRVSSFVRWFSRCVIAAAAHRTDPKRLVSPRGSSSTSPGPIFCRKLLHVPEVIAAVVKKFTAASCEFVLLSLLAVSGSPLFRLEFQPAGRSGYPTTFFTLYFTSVTACFRILGVSDRNGGFLGIPRIYGYLFQDSIYREIFPENSERYFDSKSLFHLRSASILSSKFQAYTLTIFVRCLHSVFLDYFRLEKPSLTMIMMNFVSFLVLRPIFSSRSFSFSHLLPVLSYNVR